MTSKVYMYSAALYCEACGEALIESITETLEKEGKPVPDIEEQACYDSDDFPKGPFSDGGGEADTPQHCDACQEFLENPLTDEGLIYATKAVHEAYEARRSDFQSYGAPYMTSEKEKDKSVALDTWADFYDIEPPWAENGYCEIKLDTSDDDPLQITAIVQHKHANDWAEYHGSLDGGTWEDSDGEGTFVYDILYWRPGLIEELEKEGFNLDLSEYSEPDEEEIEAAKKKYEEENNR